MILLALSIVVSCRQATSRLNEGDAQHPDSITVPLPGLAAGAKSLEMVLIEPGDYIMGSPSTERSRLRREWMPHLVETSRPLYLGRYEVTQAQWRAVMGTIPEGLEGVGDDYPVHRVTWEDCHHFIEQLNKLGCGTFRFPTEAEWEYACRAGTRSRFSFGDGLDCNDVREYCEQFDRYMWWGGNNNKHGYPHGSKRVGLKLPNPWGLFDMHGNVWEWCSDWWEDPRTIGPCTDPQGPPSGSRRVMRGGSWSSHALHLRSSDRSGILPDDHRHTALIGMRLVRVINPREESY